MLHYDCLTKVLKNCWLKDFKSLIFFCRFIYPEFLPDPKYEFRNKIREKMERSDMLKRRKVLYIPEFYVGKFNYFVDVFLSFHLAVNIL